MREGRSQERERKGGEKEANVNKVTHFLISKELRLRVLEGECIASSCLLVSMRNDGETGKHSHTHKKGESK